MDIYKDGKNPMKIAFDLHDNFFSVISNHPELTEWNKFSITKVIITPRWWML